MGPLVYEAKYVHDGPQDQIVKYENIMYKKTKISLPTMTTHCSSWIHHQNPKRSQ